jgi:hypothetical protein
MPCKPGIFFSFRHNGGAHGAPARARRGARGAPQATEPGCGAEPHLSQADPCRTNRF